MGAPPRPAAGLALLVALAVGWGPPLGAADKAPHPASEFRSSSRGAARNWRILEEGEQQAAAVGEAGVEAHFGEAPAGAEGGEFLREGAGDADGVHDGEGGESEEEEHATPEMLAAVMYTSYLLIGFVCANFVMLWLVNWPDPNVRSYVWKMISGTISIYLAVLLNNSASTFWIFAFLRREEPEEGFQSSPELEVHLLIQVALFVGTFAAVNAGCYFFRRKGKWLYAVQVIGGHICGFAGINAFKSLKAFQFAQGKHWQIVGLALIILVMVRIASRAIRDSLFGPGDEEEAPPLPMLRGRPEEALRAVRVAPTTHGVEAHGDETLNWREEACEAEDESCSIAVSYIVKVLILIVFVGNSGNMEYAHTSDDLQTLAIAEGVLVLGLVAMTYARAKIDLKAHTATSPVMRAISSAQIAVGMTMSWLALNLLFWQMATWLPTLTHELVEILSAFVLTAIAVVAIILLDKVADKVDPEDDLPADPAGLRPPPGQGWQAVPGVQNAFDGAQDLLQQGMQAGSVMDADNLEKAIRVLIDSFALAVGLAWEHAFHAALETVIHHTDVLEKNFVTSKIGLALLSCLLMLPVWLKFIVPMARKHWTEHRHLMRIALDQERRNSRGVVVVKG